MNPLLSFKITRRQVLIGIVFFIAYFAAAQLGRLLFVSPTFISPAPGVALAGLVLGGLGMWPIILLGSATDFMWNASHWSTVVAFPFVAVAQAVVAAFLLRKSGFDPLFSRRRDVFSFMLVVLLSSTIAPTLGLGIRAIQSAYFAVPPFAVTWGTWWAGVFLSMLTVGSFAIRWIAKPLFHHRTRWQLLEILLAFSVLLAVAVPLFWTRHVQIMHISLIYVLLAPLFWIALRLGPRLTTAALFLVTVNAMAGLLYGSRTISPEFLGQRALNIEIFLIIIAAIFFILTGIEEERKTANFALRSHVSRLEEALAQLSAQNQAKSEFLAVLAHELRNPLAPLLSTIELFKIRRGDRGDPEERRMLLGAEERVRTMGHLLDDLLDMSRISHVSFELHREDMELSPAIERVVDIARPLIDLRGHALSVQLPARPVWLHVDPMRFEQIVVNLLTNAAKYTAPGGRITLAAAQVGTTFMLTVQDTGMGIEPSLLDRIFEPFQQGAAKRTSGLGIGLSVVRKLAEMHGGSITAESPGPGKGSTFTLRLPASAVRLAATPAAPVPAPAPANPSALKVLVVDDNAEAAQGIGKLLSLRGHDVTLAFDGADALDAAQRETPNVILLDIGLPDMDGYEVARSLREKDTDSALVALTGYGQEEDKLRARNAGFDYHLTKPVGLAEIERVFASITEAA